MRNMFALRHDDRGAAAIELAFALPTLALLLWGIAQIGMAFQANAGMQHALGEGARLATICVNPTSKGVCSRPTNDEIKARVSQRVFGTGIGTFNVADPVAGTGYLDLQVTFTMPLNFLLFNGPSVSITRTKRVYVAGA